ncbi:hypothetical protein M413DRAFT_409953 [Hebeloma cylindrosporum]|uniref:Uncharacterized protein n=1 Tax=Hebeloma cylindrosporum TaxID=76867 RepID=A0A0C2XVP0_HEBCY|nr:hypothetical protein M413DRAFT_409953 [Hebeloma cylindrosporum h7]
MSKTSSWRSYVPSRIAQPYVVHTRVGGVVAHTTYSLRLTLLKPQIHVDPELDKVHRGVRADLLCIRPPSPLTQNCYYVRIHHHHTMELVSSDNPPVDIYDRSFLDFRPPFSFLPGDSAGGLAPRTICILYC